MTTIPSTLLLITADPSKPLAHLAFRYARSFLQYTTSYSDNGLGVDNPLLRVFFYADGAHIANGLRWQSADQTNLTKLWQELAEQYDLSLPVCVSTALARGVTDSENALRHKLSSTLQAPTHKDDLGVATAPSNIAKGFCLVGLGELATFMKDAGRVIQF